MSNQQPAESADPRVVIVDQEGQEGTAPTAAPDSAGEGAADEGEQDDPTSLIEEPAKVIRIGRMIQHLLEEVKAAPVDEAGRTRLASLLHTSITELKEGLAPQLDAELDRLVEPFDSATPSESELRIAQATLAGWLEGLFHGIQSAIYTQQMAARAQLEQMKALPPGMAEAMQQQGQHPGQPGQPGQGQDDGSGSGGMYL